MSDRPIRDILAECIRLERLGPTFPLWGSWFEEGREPVRKRADHILRLLGDRGVGLVRTGEPAPQARPDSPEYWRCKIIGRNAERILRVGANGIEVIMTEGGKETVQLVFAVDEAYALAGRGLIGDRDLMKEPGLVTKLSAALEAYRVNIVGAQ
ncbi:hypothetical protein GGQ99_004762 [Aminobacter niigataensis]|uniref:Uncharacterized protein n=1 Tax=Aminobacter niigataensis TaxID=83265 RepID=A0ABR6L8Q1_9HYPH|nr:hypothetical protein [Aminobacter niigataensis]MBB4652978.1 hypothetical protein [Aminobacter niigataensis]